MTAESTHLSTAISRPSYTVYEFAAEPTNLPRWASGLTDTTVERVDDQWVANSPTGRVTINFVEPNPFGVLDHVVTPPSGESVYNSLRVIPDGDAREVVFTLRQRDGRSSENFSADADRVRADLDSLKRVLEAD